MVCNSAALCEDAFAPAELSWTGSVPFWAQALSNSAAEQMSSRKESQSSDPALGSFFFFFTVFSKIGLAKSMGSERLHFTAGVCWSLWLDVERREEEEHVARFLLFGQQGLPKNKCYLFNKK